MVRKEITRRFKNNGEDVKFLIHFHFNFPTTFVDTILNQIEVREQLGKMDQQQQERFLKAQIIMK